MRRLFGAAALAAVVVTAVLIGTAAASKPPPPTANGCPNGGTYLVDSDVGASFSGTTNRTYTFDSWVDKNPVAGVPGLVGYCVYTNQTAGTVIATATGDNGQAWKASKVSQAFSYTRPGGEKSNIGLDGTTDIPIGSATFSTSPSSQTILLHVSDAAKCQALYGGDATTCFVLPGPKPGPVCDATSGDTGAAYDAYPKDVVDCGPPSYAFEGNFANEFGDGVTVGTAGELKSLKVVFNSYGCGDSGRWDGFNGNCVTIPGGSRPDTFQVPHGITANIYDSTNLLVPIASANIDPAIPYRHSADAVCADNGGDAARWFNPASGNCEYSAKSLLTFNFPAGHNLATGHQYVWSVAFDTTHSGYNYIGENTTCFQELQGDATKPGCGYDSLNVGYKNYPGAPYAGTDVDNDVVFLSHGGTPYSGALAPLASTTGFAGFRPLGEIIVG
jgi:hypothetical protein